MFSLTIQHIACTKIFPCLLSDVVIECFGCCRGLWGCSMRVSELSKVEWLTVGSDIDIIVYNVANQLYSAFV